MASLSINDFKAKLVNGGARSNLFQVKVVFPAFAGGDTELTSYLCKGAALPASEVANIDVMFRGKIIKVAGDRTFQPWTITIINDNDMRIRNAFERWSAAISAHESTNGPSNPTSYQADLTVEQLDKNGNITKTYHIHDAYPTAIAQIDLNFDSTNTIQEFTVELNYNYWTSPESVQA
jgi:hypothetical protein